MLGHNHLYVFAPDHFAKTEEIVGRVYYGWVWSNVSIIVGCLPLDTVHTRIGRVNAASLQLIGEKWSPLPPLVLLKSSELKDPVWIVYRWPNLRAQRFYTIQPLQLDLVPKTGEEKSSAAIAQLDAVTNANPLAWCHPGVSDGPPMNVILDHINISPVVDQLVQGVIKYSPLLAPTGVDQHSASALSASQPIPLPVILKRAGVIPLKILASLCNVPMPIPHSGSTSSKDISATLQQTDVRIEQISNSKEQFDATRLGNVHSVTQSTARYINFFNWVWLIVNDIIIGLAVGGFLCDNKDALSRLTLQFTQRYFIDMLRKALHWLDNWPVGLKLNTELSSFLCSSFAMTIDYWSDVVQLAAPFLPSVVYCIGCSGVFGVTMILSLASDLLSILTIHTYACYLLATVAFARLLRLLGSLYNLFRGKRRNILRNRTDSWNYDMDQLLLGTILFTLVTFLLPTVTVYYLLFTLTRLAIIALQASLETVLAFMNHFPLFALMLRVKDPARLPGGIELHLKSIQPDTTKLKLVNKPIPYSRIFFQHLAVWSRLSSHYSPLRLLRCLLTGEFITPIPRYSIRFGLPSPNLDKPKNA